MKVYLLPEQAEELSNRQRTQVWTESLVREGGSPGRECSKIRAAVREGVAQAERGELIEDEDVLGWLESQQRI